MNKFKITLYRTYQFFLNKVFAPFLNIKEAPTIESDDCYETIKSLLLKEGYKRPLIFIAPHLIQDERFLNFKKSLQENNIECDVYYHITPNPTVDQVEENYKTYKDNNCDSLVAIGGGSAMDLAKAVGILATNKNKDISKYRGLLKVKKHLPYLLLVPTTAGTGSETTICSVITDLKKNDKYAINDPKLIPSYAILDASLLKTLPKTIISTTGMDALTHAIEAFIGNATTKKTISYSTLAIQLIHDNLINFYNDNNDDLARKNMLKASYFAGVAFTRSYVGYVHALAHALGGKYQVAHGYANSILLPIVLRKYGKKAYKKLALINDMIKLSNKNESIENKAKAVIDYIDNLNKSLDIPSKFKGVIKKEDLPFLVDHAYKEANPLYPVVRELDKKELEEILIESEYDFNPINYYE